MVRLFSAGALRGAMAAPPHPRVVLTGLMWPLFEWTRIFPQFCSALLPITPARPFEGPEIQRAALPRAHRPEELNFAGFGCVWAA